LPNDHGRNFETLHLFSDLLAAEVNFVNLGREDGNLVVGTFGQGQTNSCLHLFSVVNDDNPLIRLALNHKSHVVLLSFESNMSNEG